MLRKIILFGWGVCLSFGVLAQETKIIGFDQVFNLNHDEFYQVELKNLAPSSQLWTAFYLIGVPKSGAMTTQADFAVKGEGIINKAHPSNSTDVISLVANHLPIRQNYSLKAFDDLVEEIEDQTGQKVLDPTISTTENVRVYGQIIDWIPEYNLQKPAKLSFGVINSQDFDIKAAYLVVGEADKTPQLLALDIHQKADVEQVEQSFRNTSRSHEFRFAQFETKFLIFLTILAATIFLNWGKWRRN
ncbi:hypothetical protein F895_00186 [Acinetobacter sp. CIP 64.2]|uniref:hypothetical protein n=1 Tax=Acinetobacter TaxID=469 RepID=UPI000289A5D5|nr:MULTISPECIES: hypothetical protein [Acinetobacter]ENX18118.1 hypothetical protein F895_00186 [Acinetobacter sp. CIP 64.2]UUM28368.1 hypothetical protein NQU59_04365 [Acinetobacter colistiniresistens]